MTPAKLKINAEPEPAWIDFTRMCRLFGISEPTGRRLLNQPDGPPFRKIGRRLLFNVAELDEWAMRRPGFNLPTPPAA